MKIEPIVWSDAFSVGSGQMDRQHQALVEMLNRMVVYFNAGDAGAAMPVLVQFLHAVERHFEDEEQLLTTIGYGDLAAQQRSHSNYQDQFSRLIASGFESESEQQALFSMLVDWWEQHILVEDMAYKTALERS